MNSINGDNKREYKSLISFGLVAVLIACSFLVACIPNAGADAVPPNSEITILNQDYSLQASIPGNIVLGNNLLSYTNATLNYNDTARAIEYKQIGNQSGSVFVGIEPFINGNLSVSLRVNSDNWNSNLYIQGSTFQIQTQTLSDGGARVYSLYDTSPNSSSYQYYDVPASALTNGVNTINIMISGTTKSLTIYHDNTLRITTPMGNWSVQKLPYYPMTLPMLRLANEKSSSATWVSTLLYGIKETVNGGLVSAIPGNDFVPFGIDNPKSSTNSLGTQYMSSSNQTGVAWVDVTTLTGQPEQIPYIKSLLDAGWELGIHYNTSLNNLSIAGAQSLMQDQYNQVKNIFGIPPTTWCSFQNADNVTHAIFAYNQLGMIWRNGYSANGYMANIGNLQETRWTEFWSKISKAQMVYPSFTHETDQLVALPYAISNASFTSWIDNYHGKHIIGFNEYYYRISNQVDTKIHYLNYVEGKSLKFSVECNQFQSRLIINFPMAENASVLKNGVLLVKNSDYSVVDNNHIALFSKSNDTFEVTSLGAPGAPESLQATHGDAWINLIWTAPSSNGGSVITGYNIYRGTTSGSEAILTTVGNVTSYNDTSVKNGQTYYYKVSAVNAVGESPQFNEVSTTPVAVTPTGTGGGGDMTLIILVIAVVAIAGVSAGLLYLRRKK